MYTCVVTVWSFFIIQRHYPRGDARVTCPEVWDHQQSLEASEFLTSAYGCPGVLSFFGPRWRWLSSNYKRSKLTLVNRLYMFILYIYLIYVIIYMYKGICFFCWALFESKLTGCFSLKGEGFWPCGENIGLLQVSWFTCWLDDCLLLRCLDGGRSTPVVGG